MIDLPNDELNGLNVTHVVRMFPVMLLIRCLRSLVSVVGWKKSGRNLTKISEATIRSSQAAVTPIGVLLDALSSATHWDIA